MNTKNHNLKIYESMRLNGGFSNWEFNILEEYPCNSSMEAHLRERFHFDMIPSVLNTNVPSRKQKEYQFEYQRIYRELNRDIISALAKAVRKEKKLDRIAEEELDLQARLELELEEKELF